jgi:hypothetical protein
MAIAGIEYFLLGHGLFDLNGGVIDLKVITGYGVELIKRVTAIGLVAHDDMTAHGQYSGR